MTKNWRIPRRTMLRGMGAAMALPVLDIMEPEAQGAARLSSAVRPPRRLACVFQPNGVFPPAWNVEGAGRDWKLSHILEPLAPVKSEVSYVSGLYSKVKGHVRATSSFLTGTPLNMTADSSSVIDPDIGISLDQLAAEKLGGETKLRSLELGTEPPRSGGESGLAISFASTVSWRRGGGKVDPEINPQAAFDRLFGETGKSRRQLRDDRSLLDRVMEEARALRRKASGNDRRKLDEYLSAARDVEKRIGDSLREPQEAQWSPPTKPRLVRPQDALPERRDDHLRMMIDLLVLGLWTDSTRVATLMTAHGFSRQNFSFLEGVKGDHHTLSHHKFEDALTVPYTKVSRWYVSMFAYMLEKMRAVDDGDGSTLLDNSIVLYGSGLKDGNKHITTDLPILLAGRGQGTLEPGSRIDLEETPLANLHLTLANKMGLGLERFNNSSGEIAAL